MVGFEKITAPFPGVEMNSFRNNRAVGELRQQLFDRYVLIWFDGNRLMFFGVLFFEGPVQ